MTDETPRPTSEDTPAPPASTRWSEEPLQEDDSLASPFVPGRSAASTTSEPSPSVSDEAPAREAPRPEEGGEAPTPEAEPDDFPFDHFDLEGGEQGPGEGEDEGEGPPMGATKEVDEADTAARGWTPADLGLDEVAEEPAAEEPAAEEPAAEEPVFDESAFDESAFEEPVVEEPTVEEPTVAGPAGEAAEILERMAELLRNDGLEAVRREMESADRLTSLLAGLVAGYVSGRS